LLEQERKNVRLLFDRLAEPLDPLRTRVRFLDALPPAERNAFLHEAESKLREEISRMEKYNEEEGGRERWFDRLAGRGVTAPVLREEGGGTPQAAQPARLANRRLYYGRGE
jgi:hypothetical protein